MQVNISKTDLDLINDIFDRKHLTQFVLYGFGNNNIVRAEAIGPASCTPNNSNWDIFVKWLNKYDVNYGVMNFNYTSPIDKIERNKSVFVRWAPACAPTNNKMKLSLFAKDVERQLSRGEGFQISIQANDIDDLLFENVMARIKQY